VDTAITKWGSGESIFAGGNSDLLALLPFLVLTVRISSVAARYWHHAGRPKLNRADSFMKPHSPNCTVFAALCSPVYGGRRRRLEGNRGGSQTFLEMYNRTYQRLYAVASEARAALTDVTDDTPVSASAQ
jgi:hypothetical protein